MSFHVALANGVALTSRLFENVNMYLKLKLTSALLTFVSGFERLFYAFSFNDIFMRFNVSF